MIKKDFAKYIENKYEDIECESFSKKGVYFNLKSQKELPIADRRICWIHEVVIEDAGWTYSELVVLRELYATNTKKT